MFCQICLLFWYSQNEFLFGNQYTKKTLKQCSCEKAKKILKKLKTKQIDKSGFVKPSDD